MSEVKHISLSVCTLRFRTDIGQHLGSIIGLEYDERSPFPTLDNYPEKRGEAPLYTRQNRKPQRTPSQYPNVPEGTLGSKKRPGIRTWFQNAAVLKMNIQMKIQQGREERDKDILANIPPHLRALKVPPKPIRKVEQFSV